MAILLGTIIGDESITEGAERGSSTFPHTILIDPHRLYQSDSRIPQTFQDIAILNDEVLALYTRVEQITDLLLNSPQLQMLSGDNQVVNIPQLKESMAVFPKNPVAFDEFVADPSQDIPPLMGLRLESATDIVPFLKLCLEFFPNPQWLPSKEGIILRDAHIGERMPPIFYQTPGLPNGIGRTDSSGWRAGPSPCFGFLTYKQSRNFLISQRGINTIDAYGQIAAKDPYTLAR